MTCGAESYLDHCKYNLKIEGDQEKAELLELQANEFRHYLWGSDGKSGLSARFKQSLTKDYGKDIELILLQFMVNPLPNWPVMQDVENYRPKEKTIGAWITLNESYFVLDKMQRQIFIRDKVMERLEVIKKRFKARKLDVDIEQLMIDAAPLFEE